MPRIDLIQFRRGDNTAWEADPILASGEPGIDLSNNVLKVGDGLRPWSELYAIGSGLGGGASSNQFVLRDVEITESDTTTLSIPSGKPSPRTPDASPFLDPCVDFGSLASTWLLGACTSPGLRPFPDIWSPLRTRTWPRYPS